jgi:hypothetical protein
VQRFLAALVIAALVVTGSALAGPGDPKKRITPADQARAKAMLLRPADMPGFTASPSGPEPSTPYCKALDESDLTLTGDGESPDFAAGTVLVSSLSHVYATRAQSDASWRRGTSAAGEKCAREVLRRELAQGGAQLVSYRRVTLPRLAERSVSYRAVLAGNGVRAFVEVVYMKHGRAQAAVVLGSALIPFDRAAELRLARLVASRMAKAMRGA